MALLGYAADCRRAQAQLSPSATRVLGRLSLIGCDAGGIPVMNRFALRSCASSCSTRAFTAMKSRSSV